MKLAEIKQNTIHPNISQPNLRGKQAGSENIGGVPQESFGQMLERLRSAEISTSITDMDNQAMAGSREFANFGSKEKPLLIDPRVPADSYKIQKPNPVDKKREAQGMAKSFGKSGDVVYQKKQIDRTSKLYEQCVEMESYLVKIMLGSMRNTLSGKTLAGEQSFADKIYKDMIYDELSLGMAKNAGFGLADQLYLELSI